MEELKWCLDFYSIAFPLETGMGLYLLLFYIAGCTSDIYDTGDQIKRFTGRGCSSMATLLSLPWVRLPLWDRCVGSCCWTCSSFLYLHSICYPAAVFKLCSCPVLPDTIPSFRQLGITLTLMNVDNAVLSNIYPSTGEEQNYYIKKKKRSGHLSKMVYVHSITVCGWLSIQFFYSLLFYHLWHHWWKKDKELQNEFVCVCFVLAVWDFLDKADVCE